MKAKLQRLWNCESLLEALSFFATLCNEYKAIAPKAIE